MKNVRNLYEQRQSRCFETPRGGECVSNQSTLQYEKNARLIYEHPSKVIIALTFIRTYIIFVKSDFPEKRGQNDPGIAFYADPHMHCELLIKNRNPFACIRTCIWTHMWSLHILNFQCSRLELGPLLHRTTRPYVSALLSAREKGFLKRPALELFWNLSLWDSILFPTKRDRGRLRFVSIFFYQFPFELCSVGHILIYIFKTPHECARSMYNCVFLTPSLSHIIDVFLSAVKNHPWKRE